ncbi:SPW repeat protein [Nitrospirillum viridazoti]|uniref:SPW repeat-containing protein n=1 Tax=Nitrospirillum amazonense TaxID=28077 RepID=A0A560HJF6_9PROT|nr:SPW repeat protein [Nitrospirillum amazonense]TWB46623.1 SPW repeat-containing protein [Nitrospirillum amazonense]
MSILAVRNWIARYGRWWIIAGWLLGFFSQADKRYEYTILGLVIASLGVWGLLLHADMPGKSFGYRRPFLNTLLWMAIALTILCIYLFYAVERP